MSETLTELEKLKMLAGEGITDAEAELLLSESKRLILAVTCRRDNEWLPVFDGLRLSLSVLMYNRRGAEGLSSRREGDVSSDFEAFTPYLSQLNAYRLIRGAKDGVTV